MLPTGEEQSDRLIGRLGHYPRGEDPGTPGFSFTFDLRLSWPTRMVVSSLKTVGAWAAASANSSTTGSIGGPLID